MFFSILFDQDVEHESYLKQNNNIMFSTDGTVASSFIALSLISFVVVNSINHIKINLKLVYYKRNVVY